jgi:serine/threonine-protein kinase
VRYLESGFLCDVFLAVHEKTNKHWVLKSIAKNSEVFGKFANNLATEVSLLNDINHLGIPSIIDIIDTEKFVFVVMDYIDGVSLSNVIARDGLPPEKTVLHWAIELTKIIEYLHSLTPPIIHKNLKPSNVMLTSKGDIMLIDFGVSRKLVSLIEHKPRIGTFSCAAPEVYNCGKTDQRTDIYGIGMVLYLSITGVRNKNLTNTIPVYPIRNINPKFSKELEYIILKCLAFNPENRYQNTSELFYDLQNIDKINRSLNFPTIFNKILSIFNRNK